MLKIQRAAPQRCVIRLLMFGSVGAMGIGGAPPLLSAQRVTGSVASIPASASLEARIAVGPGLQSRSPALQDPKYAIKAMKLTAAQEQGLAQIRARYAPSIQGYVARLNALEARGVTKDTLRATEDTLKTILAAEHAAADSLITSDQKQRFLNAMRQVHSAAVVNPVDVKRASRISSSTGSTSASAVPIP